MRVLILSNAPWAATGYGQQTRHCIRTFQDLGHEVAVHTNFGLTGGTIKTAVAPDSDPVQVFPLVGDEWGRDICGAHAKFFRADFVLIHADLQVYHSFTGKDFNFVPWFPVDSAPCPEVIIEIARRGVLPIVQSRWAQSMLSDQGLECEYVPACFDGDDLFPVDRAEARAFLRRSNPEGIRIEDDDFVVGMVANNKGNAPTRKAFPEHFESFKRFRDSLPDPERSRVKFLYHGIPEKPGGINLRELALALGIEERGKPPSCFFHSNPYKQTLGMSAEYMRHLYSSMDVLANATRGEGFGVPIIEAQACGARVITSRFSAMPELTFDGWAVEPSSKRMHNLQAWQVEPDMQGIQDAMAAAYRRRGEPHDMPDSVAAYERKTVANRYWYPVLEKISEALSGGREPPTLQDKRDAWT